MHRLFLFSNENGENQFVVISADDPVDVIALYSTDITTHDETVDIDGDASGFLCDCDLGYRQM